MSAAADSLLLFGSAEREPEPLLLKAGALTADQRANAIWKQLLVDYQQPPLDPAKDEALKEFVERRRREGGVSS